MRFTLVETKTPKEIVTTFVHLPWKEIYIVTKIAQIDHHIKVYPFPYKNNYMLPPNPIGTTTKCGCNSLVLIH